MISMAGPAASDTARAACSPKARVLAWSAGMVVARAELTVGAAAMGIQATEIEFRLLVNVDLACAARRDQPAGPFSRGCPAAGWYGPSTAESGRAPGGVV